MHQYPGAGYILSHSAMLAARLGSVTGCMISLRHRGSFIQGLSERGRP
jgi:hypothetical protein